MRIVLAVAIAALWCLPASAEDRWTLECSTDELDDTRSCLLRAFATSSSGDKFVPFAVIAVEGESALTVMPGINDFPGRKPTVRVDDNKAIADMTSKKLIEQLRKGRVVRFEFNEWPNAPERASLELDGFPVALDRLLAEVKEWKSGPAKPPSSRPKNKTQASQ